MGRRILVIASYCGENRHHPSINYLAYQLESLKRFKNNLDDVVVVVNKGYPTVEYLDSLSEFPKVLLRPNVRDSYGAWNHALDIYGDEYDWYFVVEDDYVFVLDNWDQKLIDLWEDDMGYLCSKLDGELQNFHASMTGGLVSSVGFRTADFSDFNRCSSDVYDTCSQIRWSQAFINSPLKVKSILPTYDTPFYGAGITRSFSNNPAIILPIQGYMAKWG